jgi:hypothetical protein
MLPSQPRNISAILSLPLGLPQPLPRRGAVVRRLEAEEEEEEEKEEEDLETRVWVNVTWLRPFMTGLEDGSWALDQYEIEQTTLETVELPGCSKDHNVSMTQASKGSGSEAAGGGGVFSTYVKKGCVYAWRVRAENSAGLGGFSEQISKKVMGFASAPRTLSLLVVNSEVGKCERTCVCVCVCMRKCMHTCMGMCII